MSEIHLPAFTPDRPMRVAILGAGSIARTMARTLRLMASAGEAVCLYGIASRSQEKADAFARAEGALHAFGSYEAMLADPLVDLVYIATPHAFHGAQIIQCAQAGKATLVEKAFTGNARQAEEAITAAEEAGVLTTEAIWTRYQPAREMLNSLIASGVIGEVREVHANLGYPILHKARIRQAELAGGALLDLGVYVLNFAAMLLGDQPEGCEGKALRLPGGMDASDNITLRYPGDVSAALQASAMVRTNRHGTVYGTEGWLQVDNVNNPQVIDRYDANGTRVERIQTPKQLTGYEWEVRACMDALEAGAKECPAMPHAETLRIMRQMDELRRQMGVVFPFD